MESLIRTVVTFDGFIIPTTKIELHVGEEGRGEVWIRVPAAYCAVEVK